MPKLVARILVLPLVFACGCLSLRTSHTFKEHVVEPIAKDVETGGVSAIRVFFLSYDVMTVVAVTPEFLMQFPLTTTNITAEMRDSLVRALRDTCGTLAEYPGDLRWGAHLVTKDNVVLHTIYLDRWGRGATLDGKAAETNKPLIRWFEKNFYGQAKTERDTRNRPR